MKRSMVLMLLASCGASPQPVATASHTTGPAPQKTTSVEIARADEVHFTTTGLGFYQAPTNASTVSLASATCTIDHVAGKPNRTVCSTRTARADGDTEETRFVARVNACFHVAPVTLSAAALRALETSPTTTRPESPASFITVAVLTRLTEIVPIAPIVTVDDGCKGVNHPCDPGPRHVLDVHPTNPSDKVVTRVIEQSDFAAYGPLGHRFATGEAPYPRTGAPMLYAAPMLAGEVRDRPDARFVVQRFAYPPNAWEAPSNVSVDASKETLARIVAITLDRESETVQLALVLDRAVLAYAIGDDAAGKRWVTELDAWTAAHPRAFATATTLDVSHTLETLHALASGGFSAKDPCAK